MGSSNSVEENVFFETLGLDGMPSLFYQNYWSLVGNDITQSILSYINTASLPQPLNHTFLTLILEVKNSERVGDYIPISLCNVLYKNFFKRILPSIISEH